MLRWTTCACSTCCGTRRRKNQEDLNEFRSWLNAQPGLTDAGFYEAAIGIPTRTMTLLWHGQSDLQKAAQIEAASRGITVVIKSVPYTKVQVDEAMRSLEDSDLATSAGTFRVTSVAGPVVDDDAVSVAGYFVSRSGGAQPAAVTSNSAAVADAARADIAGSATTTPNLAVKVEYGQPSSNFTTRATDTPGFNAGGMIKGANGSGCTSGFAIYIRGVSHTTTARHCTSTPFRAWSLSSSNYGSTTTTSGIGLARILSGTGFARSFDGAWNNSAGYFKTVNALADVSLGSHVCSSGANSGVHCNLVVDQMNESFNDGLGGSVTTIRVHQASGGVAGAHGDSGGPIIIPNSDGSHVWAVGMLQGSNETQTSNCGSLRIATQCSSYIEFTSMRTIINSIAGASLQTA